MTAGRRVRAQAGQASIELLGGLPALLLMGVILMQLLLVGYTAVLAGSAAEAGALAMAAGGTPRSAVASAVPAWARRGVQVRTVRGVVQVSMRPPSVIPRLGDVMRVHASAAVAAPGGVSGLLGGPLP
jgi:hypothetical protein